MEYPQDNYWQMQPDKDLAMQLAKHKLPDLIHDSVNLEGIAMSAGEVQSLLNGVSVGGYPFAQHNLAINQIRALNTMLEMVHDEMFEFSAEVAKELHESANWGADWPEPGYFRNEAANIPGSTYQPPASRHLTQLWSKMEREISWPDDIYEMAITAFLKMTRPQFFWDLKGRVSALMMNGMLLDAGYPVISIPVRSQAEFNQLLLEYFNTGAHDPLMTFLRGCVNETAIKNFKGQTKAA